MYSPFDAFEYLEYLRRRWRVLAGAAVVALALSLAISLVMPKRYTATTSLVIEPPGGNDFRLSTAVSPIYLESLKTYERFAASDSLFARAAGRFHLLGTSNSQSIESLKRRVLKVTKVRDTKILEISVTLGDPTLAQRMAQFIAEEAVSANRSESRASDQEFVEQASKQAEGAQEQLQSLQQRWSKVVITEPVEALQSEIDADVDLKGKVQQQIVEARAQAAEYEQQSNGDFAREQLQAARARTAVFEKQLQQLDSAIGKNSAALAARIAQRAALERELKVAQNSYEGSAARLREYRASEGTHAEQLRIIDPGIVPGQPSSPNIFLNVAVAVFLALVAAFVYVSLAFVYRRRPVGFEAEMRRGMRA